MAKKEKINIDLEKQDVVAEIIEDWEDLYEDDRLGNPNRRLKIKLIFKNIIIGFIALTVVIFALGVIQTLSYKNPEGNYQIVTENTKKESVYSKVVGDSVSYLDKIREQYIEIEKEENYISRETKIEYLKQKIDERYIKLADLVKDNSYSNRFGEEFKIQMKTLAEEVLIQYESMYYYLTKDHNYWLDNGEWVDQDNNEIHDKFDAEIKNGSFYSDFISKSNTFENIKNKIVGGE